MLFLALPNDLCSKFPRKKIRVFSPCTPKAGWDIVCWPQQGLLGPVASRLSMDRRTNMTQVVSVSGSTGVGLD